ncbi:RNA-directed DNA polymerase [Rhizobium sp. SRDI969]|uniref:RNA-directed DNA polymerase n=1 Tax=Rhizobium sp. SRDI969 TaxID=3138252 RepID=UPI0021A5B8DB|nr:RNA-directed DNA polymerase [Rhizobium leguminosarum]UWM83214.1 RNA-directed DNA polymerase [Rhizobium leguminosarum bv. viciae]
MSKSERLKALLETGYFPEELPPPFTTADFAKYRRTIGSAWSGLENYPNYPRTNPERFSIPKVTNWRRELAVVNPIAQYHVAKIVADNWQQISSHLDTRGFGVEKLVIKQNEIRAVPTPDFRFVSLRHSEISALHNHALVADISRFYGTLYTHAIAWALHTKAWAKANLNNSAVYDACLGARLDKAIRKGQDNQTIGIPVGPDTSRVIAEIVAVSIDAHVQAKLSISSDSIVRNVDDWYIGFDNVGQAEEAVAVLAAAARDYELEIHPEKTRVLNAASEVQPIWPTVLRQNPISRYFVDQARTIDHYFALAFHHAAENKSQNVLRFAVNLLSSVDILKQNWPQFETYLLKAARANGTAIPMVVHLLALYNAQGFPVGKERIAKFIKDTIAKSGPSAAHYEIAWVLFLAKMLRITLPADWVVPVTRLESSVCALVLLDLRQMGLLDGRIDVSLWTQAMTAKGLESNLWLVVYEADLKGWLPSPGQGFVQAHPYFSVLRQRRISFYDQARRLRNVRKSKPRKPSDSFLQYIAAHRAPEEQEDDGFEPLDFPGNFYGNF